MLSLHTLLSMHFEMLRTRCAQPVLGRREASRDLIAMPPVLALLSFSAPHVHMPCPELTAVYGKELDDLNLLWSLVHFFEQHRIRGKRQHLRHILKQPVFSHLRRLRLSQHDSTHWGWSEEELSLYSAWGPSCLTSQKWTHAAPSTFEQRPAN